MPLVNRARPSEKTDPNFLKNVFLFRDLPAVDLKTLTQAVKLVSFPKDTPIFYEGEHGEVMYIIKSGLVKIHRTAGDGRSKTLALLRQGDIFGEMSLLTDRGRTASAATVTACDLLLMDKGVLSALLKKKPDISFKIMQTLCERLAHADRQIKALALGNSRARIADMILFLADEFGQKDVIQIHLIHQDIADLAGVSRETVTKLFGEFQDEGAIKFSSKEIRILSREKLRKWTL